MEKNHELKGELRRDGYSLEEKYAYEWNRELIRRMREKTAQEKAPAPKADEHSSARAPDEGVKGSSLVDADWIPFV